MIITPEQKCCICGYKMDAATCMSEEGASPKRGDFSVCMMCGAVSVFTDKLELREPTENEWPIINRDKDIENVIYAIRQRSANERI